MQQSFELIRSCRHSPAPHNHRPTKRFCHDPSSHPLSDLLINPSSPDQHLQLHLPISPNQKDSCQNSPPPAVHSSHLPADKLTKLRAVGQTHRDNEKQYYNLLQRDIEASRRENALLFALFATRYKSDHGLSPPSLSLHDIFSILPGDIPEDHDVNSDHLAAERGLHKLSNETALCLGQKYISTALAAVMLEIIIYRRNLVPDLSHDLCHQPTTQRRRRRRTGLRVAPSKATMEHIMHFARLKFSEEHHGDEDIVAYVDRRLGSLSLVMSNWNEMEARYNPPEVLDDDMPPDLHVSPESSTHPESPNSLPRPTYRRGEGAKRCSRCNMLKYAGSGHGRSKCDDGFGVSSLVPYPASPTSYSPVSS